MADILLIGGNMQNGNIGIELRYLNNLIRRYVDNKLHKKYIDSVTGTNGWIIGYIARREKEGREVYQRDLETRFGITRSTASKVVALMVQKGLIEQQSVPGDRRVRRLTLTPKAEEVKRMMDEDHEKFEATLRKGLSEEELATLFSLLDRLQENLRGMDVKEGTEKA